MSLMSISSPMPISGVDASPSETGNEARLLLPLLMYVSVWGEAGRVAGFVWAFLSANIYRRNSH